jgi:glycosyltransferase involved in cell wall biosynthesis
VRVAVVSAWEPWRLSDAAAFVLAHQLQHLASRHEITVLAAGAPAAETAPPPEAAEILPGVELRWFGTDRARSVDFVRRSTRSLRSGEPAHVGFVERPPLLAAFDELVAHGVDLVHLHGWGTAGLAARCPGVPVVHMAIDPWSANHANRRLSLPRRLLNVGQPRRVRNHERRWYPQSSAVVMVTDTDAEAVRSVAPNANVVVVANGVEPGPVPAPPDGTPILGFHGVFDSQANVDAAHSLVTQIWPQVRQRVPAVRVLLVGRRPPRALRELVTRGIELRADVADIRPELERMTVHVDWMTSGSGIKNKVLEAMAAARPVVASPTGAAGVGAGPGVVVVRDVLRAAEEIVSLLADPNALRAAGAAGRERVLADFSWPASAASLEAVWEAAVADGRP